MCGWNIKQTSRRHVPAGVVLPLSVHTFLTNGWRGTLGLQPFYEDSASLFVRASVSCGADVAFGSTFCFFVLQVRVVRWPFLEADFGRWKMIPIGRLLKR